MTGSAPPTAGRRARAPGAGRSLEPAPPLARSNAWERGAIGGIDPHEIAAAFGTPCYVYDLDVAAARATRLRAALPPRFDLAYAVKANPSLAVIARLGALGLGADVASAGELEAVRAAGIAAADVVVTGPGKSDTFLAAAVGAGVRALTVESVDELRRLERVTASRNARVEVLLRLRASSVTGSRPARGEIEFGMTHRQAEIAARMAAASDHLDVVGVHVFHPGAVHDAATIVERVRRAMDAGRALAEQSGFRLRLVDAGGGLGIPYRDLTAPLDLEALGALLAGLDLEWRRDPRLEDVRILIEPGRFLVGPAGAYLARVTDVARSGRRLVATLDGGVHHLVAPALVGRRFRVRLCGGEAEEGSGRRSARVTLRGPLCTPLDVLAREEAFPEPRAGDLVAFLDAGAYGFTESMPLFLSHDGPAEVAVREGRAELARPRMLARELVARQRMPAW